MTRRTITDTEIALMKAMLARGMKNKDIQFFFNRPERPVNSGRISTIASGTYSNSQDVEPSTDVELDDFIKEAESEKNNLAFSAEERTGEAVLLHEARAFFKRTPAGHWILESGEHERCECKQDFDLKKINAVVRAAAALGNNKGGYILFGIENDRYHVCGVTESFSRTDVVQIVEKLKAHLSPTPTVTLKATIELGDQSVGVLHVQKHANPPIIVYRDGDGLHEGEILFRYPGQSSRIKFGDLRALLDERDRRAQVALANAAGRIADVGTGNALILDTNRNVLEAREHAILIDEKLAESLRFIKEGEFDERLGAPTLKLVGEVSPVSMKGVSGVVAHAAIFQENILEKFLDQAKVDQPVQYIYAGLAQSRLWLPVFYFARMSGKSNSEISELVNTLKISQRGKKKLLIERLEGRRTTFTKAVTQAATKCAREISAGAMFIPKEIGGVMAFVQGITAVKATKATLSQFLGAVRQCKDLAEAAEDGNAMGAVYKAACRVDELYFSE